MREICVNIGVSWLNHSPWSEKYVGLRKLSMEGIPQRSFQMEAEHSTVCHSILVGAHQLIEMAFSDIVSSYIGSKITKVDYDKNFHYGINNLPQKITGKSLILDNEPFLSMELLRKRRNATIHKTVALANVEMARSSLFTAVETVKALYAFFNIPFPYHIFLEAYPLEQSVLFSKITYPENYFKK